MVIILRLIKNVRLPIDELKSLPDLDYEKLQDNKNKEEKKNEDIIIIDLRKIKRPKNENITIVPGEVVQYENGQHDWPSYPFEGAFVMDGGSQWNGVY